MASKRRLYPLRCLFISVGELVLPMVMNGITAKVAIHANQIAPINAAITPTEADVEHARRVIAAFDAAPGAGAIAVDGRMLDRPHHRATLRIVARAGADPLKRAGNSLFVVEHDVDTMHRADWIVDVGPAAGVDGGQVLYSGPPAGLRAIAASQTARYLFDPQPPCSRQREPRSWLQLKGLHCNNLVGLDARIALGVMTAVTGVSGSGKSSLVSLALVELVTAALGGDSAAHAGPASEEPAEMLEAVVPGLTAGRIDGGLRGVRRLVTVDQKPIGRTPRSNLATYTGLFDHVRKLFAATPAARARRYDAGRFSFNVSKGRCATCDGEGFVSVELLFMPSVYAPCPACHGGRYNAETLQVRLRGKTIADVLGMTVDEAVGFFTEDPALRRPLELMQGIGLGYLRLGQPATELSGGEAQRIKLANELQRAQHGHTLYVLDEPTTGLHPADVDRLLVQLHTLVDAGNTVVLVEHDMRVAAASDWVIDMGPGAGSEGGRVVATDTPSKVAAGLTGATAPFLGAVLGRCARDVRELIDELSSLTNPALRSRASRPQAPLL